MPATAVYKGRRQRHGEHGEERAADARPHENDEVEHVVGKSRHEEDDKQNQHAGRGRRAETARRVAQNRLGQGVEPEEAGVAQIDDQTHDESEERSADGSALEPEQHDAHHHEIGRYRADGDAPRDRGLQREIHQYADDGSEYFIASSDQHVAA
jgi:hypothetical protein